MINDHLRRFGFLAAAVILTTLWVACGQQDSPPTSTPVRPLLAQPTATPIPATQFSYAPTPVPRHVNAILAQPTPAPDAKTPLEIAIKIAMAVDSSSSSTVNPNIMPMWVDESHKGKAVATVEERAYFSNVVVRARLRSAADGVLRFGNGNYLKGTGSASFTVRANTTGRDTQWDGQDAILFLKRLTGASEDFEFTDTTNWNFWPESDNSSAFEEQYSGSLPEGYTVDSRNPVWLPVSSPGGSGDTSLGRSVNSPSGSVVTEYLAGSPVTVSQADIQKTVNWVAGRATSQGGASGSSFSRSESSGSGSPDEDYTRCVTSALHRIRISRDYAAHGKPFTGSPYTSESMSSGAPKGTRVMAYSYRANRIAYYDAFSIKGRDAALFKSRVVDGNDDPSDGYDLEVATQRPLPAGEYRILRKTLLGVYEACAFTSPFAHAGFGLTVEAPPGTVHEAFFDLATTTAGVGYLATTSTTTGVLEPAGFSVRGRAITITGLEWRNGQVVLSFDRTVQLSDGLSFIETDGTAGLYLSQYDDTEDLRARTATWDVSERPWEPGDELMLRIGPIPLPGVRNVTAERGSDREVVLSWEVEYTAGVNGYRIWRHRPGRDEGPRIYVSDTLSTDTTYTDANSPVPNLTEYRVQAIDRVYNAGESSESVRVGSQ